LPLKVEVGIVVMLSAITLPFEFYCALESNSIGAAFFGIVLAME